MKPNKNNIILALSIIADCVIIIFLVTWIIKAEKRINYLETERKTLQIIQGKNLVDINKEEEINKIKKYVLTNPAPVGLIYSIRRFENGIPTHEFGAIKTFDDLKKDEQLGTCVRIVQQEMSKFVNVYKKEFILQLAKRYNEDNAKEWGENVYKIWKQYQKENE